MILKILCCLIPELLHSQTWTAGHLSSGVTATPLLRLISLLRLRGEKNYRQLWQSDSNQSNTRKFLVQPHPARASNLQEPLPTGQEIHVFSRQPVAVSQPTWQTILKQCAHDVIRRLNRTTTKETAYKPFRC